ncbi:MAG: IS110 family transposase [Armatimonadetes bacterium]|nr:IS110 family transposase [Armatimonadota bacterium]
MPRRQTVLSPPDPALDALLHTRHPHAAGLDIGATDLGVCVPPGAVRLLRHPPETLPAPVRRFGVLTADLHAIAAWLRQCGVTTVAMASTGVYGIPLYALLEQEGFPVLLVDPRQGQRAPNRPKTDVHACQWIPRLPSLGLLTAAFRPAEPIRVWRASQRHRTTLIEDAGRHLQRMGKALEPMHVKWPEVVRDLTGLTGMRMIRAIGGGERTPTVLARFRDHRCKASAETSAQALQGTWQPEPLCALQPSLALYDSSHEPLREGDRVIEEHLQGLALPEVPLLEPTRRVRRRKDNEATCDVRQRLHHVAGVDLTALAGIEESTALVVLSARGTDMSRWPSAKHCGSWLGLAPHPKKSGGKVHASATRPGVHRAAQALRLAAKNFQRSPSALGAFFRRIAARRGLAKAITATAYKLARRISAMLKHGMAYVAQGGEA